MRRSVVLLLCAGLLLLGRPTHADTPAGPPGGPRLALGFTLDLLPTVLSAVEGTFGASGQVWLGAGHVKVRFVGGRLRVPDFLAAKDGFRDLDTTALAFLVDWVAGDHFDGWWVGTGFELWLNRMGHREVPGHATWTNAVWTLGGGYIWKFWGNLYLNPWAVVHVAMNDSDATLGGRRYEPLPVSAEVSLKIGFHFDL